MFHDLNPYLNCTVETWPSTIKLLAASINSAGRIVSGIIKHQGRKLYFTRSYNPNGSCFFKVEPL